MSNHADQPPAGARILVTGGSGFIGQRLVRHLIEAGCHVSCLVRRTSSVGVLQAAGAELTTGDLGDAESVQRAMDAIQPAAVFHAAGCVRAVRSGEFVQVNVQGTEAVAAACARSTTPPVLVAISSLAAAGPSQADRPRTERDEPAPVSAYGRSKHEGERAAAKYAGDVPITVVRPPIVFGPGDRGVLQMMRPIARYGVHAVPRAGGFRLSLIHVDDLVDGLVRAWLHGERMAGSDATGRGVYFMGAPEQPTYTELGSMMARALDAKRVRTVHLPAGVLRLAGALGDMTARVRRQPGWVNSDKVGESLAGSWTCCSHKAQQQLDWAPTTALAQRLHDTARWYREAGWL